MATRTGSFGANNSYQKFINPVAMGITMQEGEYPVSISLGISPSTGARWQNINYATTLRFTLYLVSDSDWTNYVQLDTWTLEGQGYTFQHNTFNLSAANGKKFKGKTLYLRMQNTNPSTVSWDSRDYTCSQHKVTVTVTTAYDNFNVTCNAGTGGSLTASANSAQSGTTITLYPVANTGYTFSGYTTSPSVTITNNQFTMPSSNVTVTANFTKVNYSITKAASPSAGGTVNVTGSAQYGDQVSISATPATGYQFSSWSTSPSLTISGGKFTMPAGNVSITAIFTKITYSITKGASPSGGGTVTVAASAQYGDSVNISQTPNSGYYFNGWTTSPALTISGGAFTMPAQNVSITARYLRRSTASLNTTTLTGNGSATLTISTESTAYTHKYKLSFGTNMETGWVNVAAGTTSVSISIPDGWSNYIPNATTKGSGTLVLETYSGSTKIGEYTISSLTYAVRSNAVPSIGTVTKSIARTIGGKTYANVGEYFVQMHCGVRIQTSASGVLSSTISSIRVALAGYSGSNYDKTVSSSSIDFTTGLLSVAGTATINITVTDSRGRTATKTETITVTAYNAPSAQLAVRRVDSGGSDDDMGEYAKYTITNKQYTSVGNNSLTTKLASPGYSAVTISSDTGDILPGSRKTFSIQQEYAITLTMQDSFETTTIVAYVRSAKFIIYVNSAGNKLGLMKAATKNIPTGKDSTIEFSANSQIYIGDSTLEDYIRSIVNNM